MSLTNGNGSKSSYRVALEGALVIFFFQFLTLIQLAGASVDRATVMFAATSAALYGIVSWATARSVALPRMSDARQGQS